MPPEIHETDVRNMQLEQADIQQQPEVADKPMSTAEAARELNKTLQHAEQQVLQKEQEGVLDAGESAQLRAEIHQFIIDAALSDAGSALDKFNAGHFDLDGEPGLDNYEFKNFSKTLNKGIEDIIKMEHFDEFVDVQEDIQDDIDTWSNHAQLDGALGRRSVTDFLSDKVTDISPAERKKLLNAKLSDGLGPFMEGLGYAIAHEAPQMAEDILRLIVDAKSAPISINQYTYYRLRAGLSDSHEWNMKREAMCDAHPIIALMDLLVSEKGLQVLDHITSKIGSPDEWTAEGIVIAITSIVGLLAGGAGAARLGSKGGTLGKIGRGLEKADRVMMASEHLVTGTIGKVANKLSPVDHVADMTSSASAGKAMNVERALNDNWHVPEGISDSTDFERTAQDALATAQELGVTIPAEKQQAFVEAVYQAHMTGAGNLQRSGTTGDIIGSTYTPAEIGQKARILQEAMSDAGVPAEQAVALRRVLMERGVVGQEATSMLGREVSYEMPDGLHAAQVVAVNDNGLYTLVAQNKNGQQMIIKDVDAASMRLRAHEMSYSVDQPVVIRRSNGDIQQAQIKEAMPDGRYRVTFRDRESGRQMQKILPPEALMRADTRPVVNENTSLRRVTRATRPEDVRRPTEVLSVGDLHGNLDAMYHNMRSLGVIDAKGSWTGGNRQLVFHGDIIGDRHASGLDAMKHIGRLREEARRAGGDIHVIAGNHDDFAVGFLSNREIAGGGEWSDYKGVDGMSEFAKYINNKEGGSLRGNDRSIPIQYLIDGKDVLRGMQNSPEGRRILEHITQMKIVEQIDDGLFVHTDFTSDMANMIRRHGVDAINRVYQEGLRNILIKGINPPNGYQQVVDTFLNTENRHYLDVAEANSLREMGVNYIYHGHSRSRGTANVGGVEIRSVDHSYGRGNMTEGVRSIGRITTDGRVLNGIEATQR